MTWAVVPESSFCAEIGSIHGYGIGAYFTTLLPRVDHSWWLKRVSKCIT